MRPLRRGQSTAEYAILAAVVIAALLTMQIYMKRGMQGKLREATDQIGEQFAPKKTTYDYTFTTDSTREDVLSGGTTNAGRLVSTLKVRPELQKKESTTGQVERVDQSTETKLFP